MAGIGETLKRTREEKGISLDQAEEDTKIRKRYLKALEDEEYDIIPGMVYAKGFLKNYANYLGLNAEELMIEYKLLNKPNRETSEEKPDITVTITKKRAARRLNRKIYRLTVIVAALSILIFALYTMISGSTEDNKNKIGKSGNGPQQTEQNKQIKQNNITPPNQSSNSQKQPENTSPDQNNDKGMQTSGSVSIVLSAKDQSCWAKVTVDGHTVYTGNIKPGTAKTFQGRERIKFRLGNAGAVDVTVNGQSLGTLGAYGQVVDKEITSTS